MGTGSLRSAEEVVSVKTLASGLGLFDAFYPDDDALTVTELSRRTGLDVTKVSRLCSTLAAMGYLERPEGGRAYVLGMKLALLGASAGRHNDLRAKARSCLENLSKLTGETVHLGVLNGHVVVTLQVVEGSYAMRMHAAVGKHSPAHVSAIGKAMLAYRQPGPAMTDDHPGGARRDLGVDGLGLELEQVRASGFSLDREGIEEGLCCVGAPILEGGGQVVAGVAVSLPIYRFSRWDLGELAGEVGATARSISAALGFVEVEKVWPRVDPNWPKRVSGPDRGQGKAGTGRSGAAGRAWSPTSDGSGI